MFSIVRPLFLVSIMIPFSLLSSEIPKNGKQDVSIEVQRKRDEDAQRYKNMAMALGGKMLEHSDTVQQNSSHKHLQKAKL